MLNVVKRGTNIDNYMGGRKVKQVGKAKWEKINEQRKAEQELFHTREDHALNIDLSVKFVKPFIFTGIQRVKIGLLYKSNSVSFLDKLFVYDAMEQTIAPQ